MSNVWYMKWMWWYVSSLVKEWEWCIILESDTYRHIRKKEIRVLLLGVDPKTFRLLVRMLYHWAIGGSWELTPLYYKSCYWDQYTIHPQNNGCQVDQQPVYMNHFSFWDKFSLVSSHFHDVVLHGFTLRLAHPRIISPLLNSVRTGMNCDESFQTLQKSCQAFEVIIKSKLLDLSLWFSVIRLVLIVHISFL